MDLDARFSYRCAVSNDVHGVVQSTRPCANLPAMTSCRISMYKSSMSSNMNEHDSFDKRIIERAKPELGWSVELGIGC